ncbi:MAG: hypothetical protein IKP58_13515 [Victivallales bacterium]|nr:hypothetical protein [Victivallales bacterium]
MSGLKKCHFDEAVDRLKENMMRFAELSHEASARFNGLGAQDNSANRLANVRQGLDGITFSDMVMKFAENECRQLTAEIEKARERVKVIEAQFKQADEAMQAALKRYDETVCFIDNMEETLDELRQQAQDKIDTTDYMNLRLDNEVHAVDRLSEDLMSYIRNTGFESAYDRRVTAQGDLAALAKTVRQLANRQSHIEALAAKRYEAHKIQEAQKKVSVQSSEEIAIYVEDIQREEHERFMPKAFAEVQSDIKAFEAEFKQEDYKCCSEDGPKLVERLKTFYEELSSIVQAFREAEQVTRSQLQAAQDELSAVDLAEISRWSQKEDEIKKAVAQLEECARQVDEISEKGNRAAEFDVPLQQITAAVAALRALIDEATNNHARYDARDGVRKAIRNALMELKYDTPTYYFQKNLEDGSPDELSELTIYAHNPAETGNIRLTVDLDGDASLEVYREDADGNEQEVTQKDEVACHNAVLEFGRRLKTAGIHMNVTDWGKAKDLPDAQEQSRITWDDANPDKQRKSKQLERERIKERIKNYLNTNH